MNKKIRNIAFWILGILFIAWLVPLPYKPSPYPIIYKWRAERNLSKFTDPVYMPSGKYLPTSTFTAYVGWYNTYQITQTNDSSPTTVGSTIYQFSPTSKLKTGPEGPSLIVLNNTRKLASSNNCTAIPTKEHIKLCKSGEDEILVRTFEDTKIQAVMPILSLEVSIENGRLIQKSPGYNKSSSLDLMESLAPISLNEAKEKYLRIRS